MRAAAAPEVRAAAVWGWYRWRCGEQQVEVEAAALQMQATALQMRATAVEMRATTAGVEATVVGFGAAAVSKWL